MKSKQTIKVKVFKVTKNSAHYCQECESRSGAILRGLTTWDEISLSDYHKLTEAIVRANAFRESQYYYFVISEWNHKDVLGEIFTTAQQYTDWVNREDARRRKEDVAAKKKKAEGALARKQKQLQKLKDELGEK